MAAKDAPKYKCPISGTCSTRKIHRRCLECAKNGNDHCWDCCGNGGTATNSCKHFCPEPLMSSVEYEIPED